MSNRIYLSPPDMSGKEKKLLIEAFNSNWIAPLGPEVDQLEKEFSKYLNIENCLALSSGTAGLHLALNQLHIKPNDIVLCPSLTFVATANVIRYVNATPVFIDVDKNSWTIDINCLEKAIKKYKPKALLTVDLYGNSANYNEIIDLCNKFEVKVIEDAAESLGSEYENKKCGTFGEMGIFSFNGNKIITTSGGGLLVSSNKEYIKNARKQSMQSRENKIYYEHKQIGFNYRMSNLLASIGRGQLNVLENKVKKKRKIFGRYKKYLKIIESIKFLEEPIRCKSNRWLTTFVIDNTKTKLNRNELIDNLEKHNIESRPVWKPMHKQPYYKSADYVYINNDVSNDLFNRGICLPSGTSLTIDQQDKIIDIIIGTFKKY